MIVHLGSRVSALVDGTLPEAEAEHCWSHVHACPPCRDLVEHEGWVKSSLARLAPCGPASSGLKASLLDPALAQRASHAEVLHHHGVRTRSRSLWAVGGGAAGAVVVGVMALGAGVAQPTREPQTDQMRAAVVPEGVPAALTSAFPSPATAAISAVSSSAAVDFILAIGRDVIDFVAASSDLSPPRSPGSDTMSP